MTSTVDLGTCFKFNAYPCSFKPFLNEIEPDWSREEKNSQLLVLLCPRPLTKKLYDRHKCFRERNFLKEGQWEKKYIIQISVAE